MLLCGLLIAGLGACGGDDDTDASDSGNDTKQDDSGLDAAAPTAAAEFCEGFHNLDLAFATAPEDPAQMEAFVTEQVTPNVALVEANAPTEIDASITTMVGAVEQVTTSGDFSAFETPEFTEAQEEVYPYLPEGCGWAEMETTAVDFSYEGMPETAEAGTVVITMANDSAAGEPHELGLVKLTDAAADLTVEELLALPEAEQEQYFDMESPRRPRVRRPRGRRRRDRRPHAGPVRLRLLRAHRHDDGHRGHRPAPLHGGHVRRAHRHLSHPAAGTSTDWVRGAGVIRHP